MRYRFPRSEKLKSKKLIAAVFENGKSFSKYPVRLVFLEVPSEETESLQAAFTVPKRSFKKAVDRNRLKRLLREAYRLNKPPLQEQLNKHYALVFIYTGREKSDFKDCERAMIKLLTKLQKADAEQ